MKNFNKKTKSKGAVLAFSIMISLILLTLAIGTLNITTKEMIFSTSSKNSNDAFYAADSGIECALFNDMSGKNVFTEGGGGKINCLGGEIPSETSYPFFQFKINNLGNDGQACAKISVNKKANGGTETQIISKGYNLGGDNNCDQFGLTSIERAIEVNYTNEK